MCGEESALPFLAPSADGYWNWFGKAGKVRRRGKKTERGLSLDSLIKTKTKTKAGESVSKIHSEPRSLFLIPFSNKRNQDSLINGCFEARAGNYTG